MILGIGIDLVEISRIQHSLERFGELFLKKILHQDEIEALGIPTYTAPSSPGAIASIAARFAAKEAGVKALGTGFTNGIGFHDLRISSLDSGKPELAFFNKAKEQSQKMKVSAVMLSLTHSKTTAAAVVIIE